MGNRSRIVEDLGGGRVRIALSQDGQEFDVTRDSLIVDPKFQGG
jgi:hypothetical protein